MGSGGLAADYMEGKQQQQLDSPCSAAIHTVGWKGTGVLSTVFELGYERVYMAAGMQLSWSKLPSAQQ